MPILIVLQGNKYMYKLRIEEGKDITIGSGKKDNLWISDLSPKQIKVCLKKNVLYLKAKDISDFDNAPIESEFLVRKVSTSKQLAVCWCGDRGVHKEKLRLPYQGMIRLGRSEDNHVVLTDSIVSGHHLTIRCENGKYFLEDGSHGKPSTNGTFLNGKRVSISAIESGDVIDIMHIRICLKNGEMSFYNIQTQLKIHSGESLESGLPYDTADKRIFRRSPRTREELPSEDIVLARPPMKEGKFEKRRGMFTSLLSTGAMMGASVAMGAASPALLAARAASLVAPVSTMAIGGSDNKKGKKKWEEKERLRNEKYSAYIQAQKSLITLVMDKQREILNKEYPAPDDCISIAVQLRRNLWERKPEDDDFLNVRIGLGYEPLCVSVKSPLDQNHSFQIENDEAEELVRNIISETRIVDFTPARISLKTYETIGIIGKRKNVIFLIFNMIISLVTAHFYEDVKIVGIFDPEEKNVWNVLRWLPHIWDEEKQSRFLAFTPQDVNSLNNLFQDILGTRLKNHKEDTPSEKPHYIFLIGSRTMTENVDFVSLLLSNSAAAGATAVFAYKLGEMPSAMQMSYLPSQCQFIIDTDDFNGMSAYDVSKINNKYFFTLDKEISVADFDQFCRNLASIEVAGSAERRQLPSGITFLQGMGVNKVTELDAWNRWTGQRRVGTLNAPFAAMSNGKALSVDIGNENEPPVALVAGMAGSGKSELLASWLLSIALNYHPDDISFVVIDFKGGALANSLEGLPHMVGKITDLGNNTQRILVSLIYEIKRREAIFDQLKLEQKLSKYMKGYHEGKYKEPLPYLLIVCDEFAELKKDQPEFAKKLDTVARLGRSIGIRLICAMQNPMGVVNDELRANSCMQICLKVQNVAASKDMILRPDAARLKQNGRAYVRVGPDSVFELVQSFYSGAPYLGENRHSVSTGNLVRIVEMNGTRIKTIQEEKTRFRSEVNELQAVSAYLTKVASEHHLNKMSCPWKPELPDLYNLDDVLLSGTDGSDYDWSGCMPWLQVPFGIYDEPQFQNQGILSLNFDQEGHYGIFGAPGTGKTTLLKTIIASLGKYYKPSEVNIYILDLGSYTMRFFEDMPHVGGVALSNEEEKFAKLAHMLRHMLEQRKKEFSAYGINSLREYRENVSSDMPAVIVAIDNLVPVFELYPDYSQLLLKISSEGSGLGIYLVYTANSSNKINFNIIQNTKGKICFEMGEKSDYAQLVGKGAAAEQAAGIPGRGFCKNFLNHETPAPPLLFQASVYCRGTTDQEQSENLKYLCLLMAKHWDGPLPARIPYMPEVISPELMKKVYNQVTEIPVGMYCDTIEPAYLNLSDGGSTLLTGDPKSGKSQMLLTIAKLVHECRPRDIIYVFDSSRKSLEELRSIAAGYIVSESEKLEECDTQLKNIISELKHREDLLNDSDELGKEEILREFPQICIYIDDMNEMVQLMNLSEPFFRRLNAVVKNIGNLSAALIAACRRTDMLELSMGDPVTIHIIKQQNGLALSGSAFSHNYYKADNLGYEEKKSELQEGYGLLYEEGICRRIKLFRR